MKKTIKTSRLMSGMAAVCCAAGVAFPANIKATVSDADFDALTNLVQRMEGKIESVEETNKIDQQIIQNLEQKLGETEQTSSNAEQQSVEAAQTEPLPREPIDEATVNHNFMMLGDAEFQYVKSTGQNGAFLMADFAPIFLYRGGDDILFEVGFDTTIQNNAPANPGYTTTFNMSFAQLDYVIDDYMTLCVGDLLLPLGTYSQRGAGWLNEIPDDPLAVDALLPGTGVGAELLGAVPLGDAGKFINYSAYVVDGPGSADGTGNADALDLGGNVGLRSDGVVANLHGDPSGGARLGVFMPFAPHCDLELGISGQTGEWDEHYLWTAGVFDAALHLGPNFEAKSEFIQTRYGSDDQGQINQQGWYAQVSYKLAGLNLELPVINDLELVDRYDYVRDGLGTTTRRYTTGLIYYITNTLLFESDYEFLNSNDPTQANQLILQLSYGF